MRRSLRLRLTGAVAASLLGAAAVALSPAPASAAVVVVGSGSTWSQIAVDQWRADVARQGITINYQGVGSTAGRTQYYQSQVDFAVSEIPFQAGGDGPGGINEINEAARRPYSYMPIVAGGTSFMYHLDVGGRRITDLRLSPETLAKVFTGVIRSWNDPAITADNNGRALPAIPIKVAVRSDGSGTTAQFTAFMFSQTRATWQAYCAKAGTGANCGQTSFYPNVPSLGFASVQLSDGVANYVAAPYNNGAITYVEYGYAKERGYPVAAIKNKAGQYVLPLAGNVSEALKGATFNSDNTQNLEGVYTSRAPGAYPVSSYSYMIVPKTTAAPFSTEKGKALSQFILYFLCAGQQKAEQLGYAPLPKVLVENAFAAVRTIPGHIDPPAITNCANPAITGGGTPPPPPPPPPPPGSSTTVAGNGGSTPNGGNNGGGNNGGGNNGGGTVNTGAGGSGQGGGSGSGGATTGGGDTTGGVPTPGADGGTGTLQNIAYATPMQYPAETSPVPVLLYVFSGIVLLGVVFGPPLLAHALRARASK